MKPVTLKLRIEKADGLKGFAAYEVSPAKSENKKVLLNVYATFLSSLEADMPAKEIMIQNLMHEFGHILEQWFGLNFSEKRMHKFTDSYIEKYGNKSYEEVHGDQTK